MQVPDSKQCTVCSCRKPPAEFWKHKRSKDGLSEACIPCCQARNRAYYAANKDSVLAKNAQYRAANAAAINSQRKEYRERPDVHEHIRAKQKEYLGVRSAANKQRRVTDPDWRLSQILRSKVHKMLKGLPTSYRTLIGCSNDELRSWLEYNFTSGMTWENFGSFWVIDHCLPIARFALKEEVDQRVCFHWSNLQPLEKSANRSKSAALDLRHVFGLMSRFHQYMLEKNLGLAGYQALSEKNAWLRHHLRYGDNPPG
jgi:hypothetical protein